MKHFKVYKKENDELVLTYFGENENEIWGLSKDEVYHVEISEEEMAEDQKKEKTIEIKGVLKKLLAESDWTQLKDAHLYLTEENIQQFAVYRDYLRKELERAESEPWNVVIPQIPQEIKIPL